MWILDGDAWTEVGGNCGNEAPAMIDDSRYQELHAQLQIQEIALERPASIPNPAPWVPARRIAP